MVDIVTNLTGFPLQVIKPTDKVLSLFCAAYGGQQDVHHIFLAGVTKCTMVDIDDVKLKAMRFSYDRLCADCFEIIDRFYVSGEKFDVVVSDHWTGQDEKIHGDYLAKLKVLAPVRILGICSKYLKTQEKTPDGTYYKRSNFNGGVYWRLL
jgi:hypothetical protein